MSQPLITAFIANPIRSPLNDLLRRRSSTDLKYLCYILPQVAQYESVQFVLNRSVLQGAQLDMERVTGRVRRKPQLKPTVFSLGRSYVSRCDVIYSYGASMREVPLKPMIYQDVFCEHWLPGSGPSKLVYHEQAIEQATLITTWSPYSALVFSRENPHHAHKIRVTPPFIPSLLQCMITPEDKMAQNKTDYVKFVFVGNEALRKGLDTVVAAWGKLTEAHKKMARLTVCSSMTHSQISLPSDIEYRGYEHNVPALLKRADVLVLPSKRESFGFVFLEAAFASCAIIAPDLKQQRSILPEAGTEFIHPLDIDGLAATMTRLIEDRTKLEDMQRQQFCAAIANYYPAIAAKKLYDVFAEAVALSSGRA